MNATDPPGSPAVTSKIVTIEYQLNLGPESAAGAEACLTVPCVVDVPVTAPADTITQSVSYADPGGILSILVRVRDGAGNWSTDVTLTP